MNITYDGDYALTSHVMQSPLNPDSWICYVASDKYPGYNADRYFWTENGEPVSGWGGGSGEFCPQIHADLLPTEGAATEGVKSLIAFAELEIMARGKK